jgi:hypothetical protein
VLQATDAALAGADNSINRPIVTSADAPRCVKMTPPGLIELRFRSPGETWVASALALRSRRRRIGLLEQADPAGVFPDEVQSEKEILMATTTTVDNRRETVSLIGSDKVEGTAVYGANDERIGSVQRVMIDKISGKVAYAVISF